MCSGVAGEIEGGVFGFEGHVVAEAGFELCEGKACGVWSGGEKRWVLFCCWQVL